MKRAAVYIRVSSEEQADGKISPIDQENDSLAYCESRGYQLVGVYRDITKYRSKGKMVEPSATRNDRPGLVQMLKDSDAGMFDVLIAWKGDRLYRGVTLTCYEITSRVKQKTLSVELVKETYDVMTAEILAAAFGIELQSKRDRFVMGVGGRLAKGQDWNSPPPYGYKRVDGVYQVDENEAVWVQKMWEWFGNGSTGKEIRDQLTQGLAPQRAMSRQFAWTIQVIYKILKREAYHTGVLTRDWRKYGGKVHMINIPIIIDQETARKVQERFSKWKQYPAGNLKELSVAAGLVYCASCGVKMIVRRNSKAVYYSCGRMVNLASRLEGCAGYRSLRLIDNEIWSKIAGLLDTPNLAESLIEDLKPKYMMTEEEALRDLERISREYEALRFERMKVIGWARKEIITEGDLEIQLNSLDEAEKVLSREFAEKRLIADQSGEGLKELEQIIRDAFFDFRDIVMLDPRTPEEAQLQFEKRRDLVQKLVRRVDVFEDKSIKVTMQIGAPENISQQSTS
jgi:site-specific DNA recombinase